MPYFKIIHSQSNRESKVFEADNAFIVIDLISPEKFQNRAKIGLTKLVGHDEEEIMVTEILLQGKRKPAKPDLFSVCRCRCRH